MCIVKACLLVFYPVLLQETQHPSVILGAFSQASFPLTLPVLPTFKILPRHKEGKKLGKNVCSIFILSLSFSQLTLKCRSKHEFNFLHLYLSFPRFHSKVYLVSTTSTSAAPHLSAGKQSYSTGARMLKMLRSHMEINWCRPELCGKETRICARFVIFGLTEVVYSHGARQPSPDRRPGGLWCTLGAGHQGHRGVWGAPATENATHQGKRNPLLLLLSSLCNPVRPS